ncbi:hypothetical protein NPA07_02930 [Mycoplasmopsis caviae]|uniref:Uncharacterized protein n=1 Tax=Mycoplasmopsis caviae TaxID=55603 RepID=A0ABY5IYQ6_9BACT|nr:hypothetical protein [Mycoplasmopsis caviae]UUD34754.1 hypothetical protein NPA07_02930 [Mycoplasmopsis caviae]
MRVKNELTRLNLIEKYSYNQIINYLKSFKNNRPMVLIEEILNY